MRGAGRITWAGAALAMMLAISAAGCRSPEPPEPPRAEFRYQPFQNLSREERAIEDRYAAQISANLPVYVAAYRHLFGNVVNTDSARELSRDYAPDGPDVSANPDRYSERNRNHRMRYTLATQGPSRELAIEVYRQMLREQPGAGVEHHVVFTAGGAGSGKSTSIGRVTEVQSLVDRSQIVFDTTMSNSQAADLVQMALATGRKVTIVYVYRRPEDAFAGMIGRARATGRPVSLDNFVSTHLGAPRTILAVIRRFRAQIASGQLVIRVIDNTGRLEDAREVANPNAYLAQVSGRYHEGQLKRDLRSQLDRVHPRLPRDMYNQIAR